MGAKNRLTQLVQLLSGLFSFGCGRFQMLILLLEGYLHEFLKDLTTVDLSFSVPLTRAVALLPARLYCLLVGRGPPLSWGFLAPPYWSFWVESSR